MIGCSTGDSGGGADDGAGVAAGGDARTLAGLRERYGRSYAAHGATPEGLCWTADGQASRFAVIASLADFSGASVLDVGCGFADLYPVLRAKHGAVRYTGVELLAESSSAGRARYPEAEIITGTMDALDAGRRWDFVVESGIFNTREYSWPVVAATVRAMYLRCNRAVIANFLSPLTTGTFSPESLYHEPSVMCELAASVTRRFELHHHYRDNDFTLVLHRVPGHPGLSERSSIVPHTGICWPRRHG